MLFIGHKNPINQSYLSISFFFHSDMAEVKRTRNKEARKRREERIAQKREDMLKAFAEEDKK